MADELRRLFPQAIACIVDRVVRDAEQDGSSAILLCGLDSRGLRGSGQ
jgi:hypothetical protein